VDTELVGTPIEAVSLGSWFAGKLADPGGLGHCEAGEGCGKGGWTWIGSSALSRSSPRA